MTVAQGSLQTVTGRISGPDLGITLTHEHLLVTTVNPTFQPPNSPNDLSRAYELNWANSRDDLILDNEQVAISEADLYRQAGGRTIVDVTSVGIGRNPEGLTRIANATGLNIVMGSGYYVAPTHPQWLDGADESAIADEILRDFEHGVGDTGIRPGVIGEIGCSWPLADSERKVLRAAAKAQRQLGCALIVHPGRDTTAPAEILEILRRAGGDINRVVISHIERTVQEVRAIQAIIEAGGRNQPRHDLLVENMRISIKTETGASTDPKQITITKLCTTERDPWEPRSLVRRVMEHLGRYDIILMFRAVWETRAIHYQLVEIPVETLRLIKGVTLETVGRRAGRQSLGADVIRAGARIFHVHFDASDGKCQIRNLGVEHCVMLEEWDVRL